MKQQTVHRIMFAAPASGSGKTSVTCGFLSHLVQNHTDVTAFKCGPDYIDPMFHKQVLGIPCGNLDTFFCGHEETADLLASCNHEYAVLEGVMGIYDGLGGIYRQASCYDVACATNTPIILVMDAQKTGRTLISLLKGILADDNARLIKGILLNKISAGFYARISPVISRELEESGYAAKLLGFLPKVPGADFSSRHLGLLTPSEIPELSEKIRAIQSALEENCDLEEILHIMQSAPQMKLQGLSAHLSANTDKTASLPLAVAMDEAFCFYYTENLRLLEACGVKIIPFSPLHDIKLPEGIKGIYIGGGYPELFLKELSENTSMLNSIRSAIESGIPSLAECGGFMYLHESITDTDGTPFSMVGSVKGTCKKKERPVRFGYVELSYEKDIEGNPLLAALSGMRGHEFHYYESNNCGRNITVKKAGDTITWPAMHIGYEHVWGFPHLYFASAPEFLTAFTNAMRSIRGE